MAVKQTNNDGNGTSADSSQGKGPNATGTKSKKMNSNVAVVGKKNGTVSGSMDDSSNFCSDNEIELPSVVDDCGANLCNDDNNTIKSVGMNNFAFGLLSTKNKSNTGRSLSQILQVIDILENNKAFHHRHYNFRYHHHHQNYSKNLSSDLLQIYKSIIWHLAHIPDPRQTAEDLKQFKEDIAKVGAFFAKTKDKLVYHLYLQLVFKLIAMDGNENPPSYALAVIFQLYETDMIAEAVQALLELSVPDKNIKQMMYLLCEWLRVCNFCQNLNVWILAFLRCLQKQQKRTLFVQIALDNIEQLFSSLIIPVLRPKVGPIILHMLKSVDQTPVVFHKIIPKLPRVINVMQQQQQQQQQPAGSSDDYADSARKLLSQLVCVVCSLMEYYYGFDALYEPIKYAVKDFQSSLKYIKIITPDFNNTEENDVLINKNALPYHIQKHTANVKVGLTNLGNTCYMNSVLQALAMTKEFSREILLSESKAPLLIKMQQQIALMLYSSRSELSPGKILSAVLPPGFSLGLQQDSSEFLGHLLEALHEQELLHLERDASNNNNNNDYMKKLLRVNGIVEPSKRSMETDFPCSNSIVQKRSNNILNDSKSNDLEGKSMFLTESFEYNDEPYDCHNDKRMLEISKSSTITQQSPASLSVVDTNCVQQFDSKQEQSQLQQKANSPKCIPTMIEMDTNDTQSTNDTKITTEITVTENISTIEKTFTGKMATSYKCLTCGWCSCNADTFRDLQLSFPIMKNECASNYSVQDLIEYYCSPEKLDGENQYFCEKCKKLSDAVRYINVISAPKNLILTLKHFKYDQKCHMRAKLMHKVFHDEKVCIKVCSPENLREISTVYYDLYAGVVHSGLSMDSGHYYTYAADATNKWYKFNDNVVSISKAEELNNLHPPNTPYILFYQMSASSTETLNSTEQIAATTLIKVDIPVPLALDELPRDLREFIKRDDITYKQEIKLDRRYKSVKLNGAQHCRDLKQFNRNSYNDDDDEDDSDEQKPSRFDGGCGSNASNINVNRFIF